MDFPAWQSPPARLFFFFFLLEFTQGIIDGTTPWQVKLTLYSAVILSHLSQKQTCSYLFDGLAFCWLCESYHVLRGAHFHKWKFWVLGYPCGQGCLTTTRGTLRLTEQQSNTSLVYLKGHTCITSYLQIGQPFIQVVLHWLYHTNRPQIPRTYLTLVLILLSYFLLLFLSHSSGYLTLVLILLLYLS